MMLARHFDLPFEFFSAVLSGIKEVKEFMARAEQQRRLFGKPMILFIDEIHRFNKAQQAAFLPYVEKGDIILFGSTTENPSFEVIAPLLSRTRVLVLKELDRGGARPYHPGRPRGQGPRPRRGRSRASTPAPGTCSSTMPTATPAGP